MDTHAHNRPVKDLRGGSAGLETLDEATSSNLLLLFQDSTHLVHVVLDEGARRIVLEATETGKRRSRIVPAAARGKPSGGLGDEMDTETQGQREEDSKADDDPPRCALLFDLADAVVDKVADEDADGDEKLV